jgi:hypothetical protein
MKSKICYLIVIVIFSLACIKQPVLADEWQDEDVPISFKIEMLPWEEADHIIPKKAKFTIIDVETGLKFKVQRRAGSRHADVQPLSKKDTAVMKKIYKNKWSWDRRAIIVSINDQLIAASMNGMPHGGGALQNGFRGHFCVHFSGSITHKLHNQDPAHKLMILKAAGKIDDYVYTVGPSELLNIFSIAINQGDNKLLELTLSTSKQSKSIKHFVKDIQYFSVSSSPDWISKDTETYLAFESKLPVEYLTKKEGKIKKKIKFVFRRDSLADRWVIDRQSLLKQF